MDSALRPHYELVEDLLDPEDFEERVAEHQRRTGHLITRDVLALRVVDELGRNEGAVVDLVDLDGRNEATVRVRVHDVGEVRTFDEDDRGPGQVVNVQVHDHDRRARLVLWDDDVDLVGDGSVNPGDVVRVVNARVKHTSYGVELHVGRWSEVQEESVEDDGRGGADDAPPVDPPEGEDVWGGVNADPEIDPLDRPTTPLSEVLDGERDVRIRAEVVRVEPTKLFKRKDGSTGFLAKAHVRDGSSRTVLTCWDEHVKELQGFDAGDEVVATALRGKTYRGRLELHTTADTRLLRP